MTDARRYAVWPDARSRSRSRGFWSSKNCTFLGLSPPFTMAAGKWPLILKLQYNIYFFRAEFLLLVLVFVSRDLELGGSLCIVRPPKSFSDFNEIWCVDRARWVMHDGMPYDPIQGQGQGHECWKPLKRSRPSVPHGTVFCVWNISGTAKRIFAKFTWKTSLVPRWDEFEGQGHQGQKTAFFQVFLLPACGLCLVKHI